MLTVYKASAGSGKTHTLALEFIKNILGKRIDGTDTYRLHAPGTGNHHRSILAITFTNKATEEMKRRIVRELAVLAGAPLVAHRKSDYRTTLRDEIFHCSDAALTAAAQEALRSLLFDFNFFNVSTIDAFFQTILRVFAREAELTGNYEVELDDRTAIETGINDMLASITTGHSSRRLESWLERFMQSQFESGNTFNLFNRTGQLRLDLVKFVNDLTGEDYKIHAEALSQYFDDPSRLEKFEIAIRAERNNIIERTASLIRQLFDALTYSNIPPEQGLQSNLLTALNIWLNKNPKAPTEAVRNMPDKPTEKRFRKAYIGFVSIDLDDALVGVIREIISAWDKIAYLDLVAKQLFRLGMLADILRHVMEFRQENNMILLSDTNDLLRRIIGGDDTPFIYERIGLWLQHFLIDEFQDTSRMQWQNLEPLVAQSLSEGNDSLIIGDEKQCIYRFRNSDPSLLQTQVFRSFPGMTDLKGNNSGSNTNWRSSVEVITFNNAIFELLAAKASLSQLYSNVRQAIPESHNDHHGYVRMTHIDAAKSEDFASESLRVMASEICRQLDSGYSQRDIAILVRKKDKAKMAISYLLDEAPKEFPRLANINVLSDEALLVSAAPAVKAIVSVLRTIDRPIPSTKRGYNISEGEFAAVIRAYNQTIAAGGDTSAAIEAAVAELSDDTASAAPTERTALSLPSLIESIIRDVLTNETRQRDAIYIAAFQDLVIDFCAHSATDINTFLNWWDSRGSNEYLSTAPDINAIRVMTIHKSKGLEFPCVHIPFATWPWIDLNGAKWFPSLGFNGIDPDIIPPMVAVEPSSSLVNSPLAGEYHRLRMESITDEINATYVAFTRAVDELIVNYDTSKLSDSTYKLGALLGEVLSEMEASNSHAVDAEGVFTIGSPTVRATDNIKNIALDEPTPYDITTYNVTDRNDIWSHIRIADIGEMSDRRVRGILLHDILAHVRTATDIPRAVRQFAASGRLHDIATEEEAEALLRQAVADPRASRWFAPDLRRVLTERTLTHPKEGNYRPDRVVWTADGTVEVIDYKFGEEKPKLYGRQLSRYMRMLDEMGFAPVKGFIWYVDTDKIAEVAL